MAQDSSFDALCEIVARLRAPGGCPWDREQTHASLKGYLLEEAYEALEALDQGNTAGLREELGDLLLQILLQSQIAAEAGEFQIEDVVRGIAQKLVHRHPHVFGDAKAESAQEVAAHWDRLKKEEEGKGEEALLSGVPKQMPALAYSQAVQRRASRAGFEWREFEGILEKLVEELQELRQAPSGQRKTEEFGDLLFALADAARWLEVDLEEALRLANERFYRRFTYMEELCRQRGLSLERLSLDEQNALWEEAKRALS